MDIKERSKAYVNDKALDAISAVIEQAYADGFNDGMSYLQLQKQEAIKNGVEYIDLDLPSGTLWSSKYVNDSYLSQNRLPHIEASKLNIPTKDQFLELCNECFATYILGKDFHGIKFIGKNGGSIVLKSIQINEIEFTPKPTGFRFWLKDIEGPDSALYAKSNGINNDKVVPLCEPLFTGLHLPIMLIK